MQRVIHLVNDQSLKRTHLGVTIAKSLKPLHAFQNIVLTQFRLNNTDATLKLLQLSFGQLQLGDACFGWDSIFFEHYTQDTTTATVASSLTQNCKVYPPPSSILQQQAVTQASSCSIIPSKNKDVQLVLASCSSQVHTIVLLYFWTKVFSLSLFPLMDDGFQFY